MPARDTYHQTVRNALIKDGWSITHDPLHLFWGGTKVYIDLGATKFLAAEKGEQKIAIEVKSFLSPSKIHDLEDALGHYFIYEEVLLRKEPERVPFIAIPDEAFVRVFEESLGKLFLESKRVNLIIFDPVQEEILQWIP
jgi:hypothetical protein